MICVGLIGHFVQDALIDQNALVHAVCTPGAIFCSLKPADPNNGVKVIGRVTEIVLDIYLVVAHLVSPNQCVGQSLFIDLWVVADVEYPSQPVEILSVVHVGHLKFVHVK